MTGLAIVPRKIRRRQAAPGPEAAAARSARSRRSAGTLRLARAIAGDRAAGIRWALDRLEVDGKLRERCELLFAMGAHLNPLEDAAAVLHAAQLELQAGAHQAFVDAALQGGAQIEEWRSKAAAYSSVAALRALVVLRLTPSTRKPVGSSREGRARTAAATTAALEQYR